MLAHRRKPKKPVSASRDISIECLACRKNFQAVIPVLSRICPGCHLSRTMRPERFKYSVTEAFEGRRVYIVKRFTQVGANAYWQYCHEAVDIEDARAAIPEGARRYSKGLLDPSDVVETWIS
jgi:hypothetical protein